MGCGGGTSCEERVVWKNQGSSGQVYHGCRTQLWISGAGDTCRLPVDSVSFPPFLRELVKTIFDFVIEMKVVWIYGIIMSVSTRSIRASDTRFPALSDERRGQRHRCLMYHLWRTMLRSCRPQLRNHKLWIIRQTYHSLDWN